MALDILHDNWGPYTHTEVENALKAYLADLEGRINQAIQEGGVGLEDLSAEVRGLLDNDNIAAWAKAQNKPGYTVSEITGVEGFQNLLAKLQDMDQKIQAAGQSGGVDPDDEMSSTSEKPVQNKVIKAYVDNLINGLINGAPAALDTLNELSAALGNDANFAATITNALASKANDNAVVKSIIVNGGAAQTPTNGNVNIVVEGAQGKSAYQSYYDTTSDNPKMTEAQWVASLKGPRGDTGNVVFEDLADLVALLVNDLDTGGPGNFLSAEMGKELKAQLDALEDVVEELDEGAGYDISVTETAIVFTSRNMPHVSVGEVGNHNVSCKAGSTATTSFYVSGRKLTSAIQIAVSDATNWSVSTASISPTNGKVALTLVTITYHPASGTASDTTHNCNVDVSSGNTTFGTIAMVGTVAAAPSITLTMSSATITTTQDTPATATLNVKGSALEGDITLAISGTGFTLSDNSVDKADAESAAGADVTVTFDGSAAGPATITATSTNATNATASVSGVIPTPLAEGSYFNVPANNGNGSLKYTVLANGNVAVSGNTGLSSTEDNPLVIPATVNDSDATGVYNSSGTAISASGLSYNVTEVVQSGFNNLNGGYGNVKAIRFSEGLKTIRKTAFKKCPFTELVFPRSLTSFDPGNASNAFEECTSLRKITFLGSVTISSYAFYKCTSLEEVILNGNPLLALAFRDCTQFEATSGDKPVVVNYAETYYDYKTIASAKPFPQNGSDKVWATLYCRTSAGFPGTSATSWNCFEEILDISNYNE